MSEKAEFDALGYYRLLQVSPTASASEIKCRYRELAKVWHPDHCREPDALEVFQKLSVAYETLQDDARRQEYDLLSLVYDEASFPDRENMQPIFSEPGNPEVRRLNLINLRGLLWKYRSWPDKGVYTYSQALRRELYSSCLNWLLGWWSPQSVFRNVKVLLRNFKTPDAKDANLRLLVHNAVACFRTGHLDLAARSAVQALEYVSPSQKAILQNFIAGLKYRIPRPQLWKWRRLRLVQLVFPAALLLLLMIPFSASYVTDADLMNLFSRKHEISYYQEVRFRGGSTVDDVVVGKVLNIPVDRSDLTRLYHFKSAADLMYGPSDDFDVIKRIPARTTVRLTGLSPDNIWARVMIDNGEMGYVRQEELSPGLGLPVPEYSKVYRAE